MKRFLSLILCMLMSVCIFTGCSDTQPENAIPDESLLLDANVMTDYLCRSLNSKKSPEEADFNYLQFVFSCFYYKDQPDFCYYDATPLTEDESLVINLDASRKIMHQVFGIDWDITENVNGFSTRVSDNNLLFTTGFGWGLMVYYPGEYIYSDFSDDSTQVVSHFDLNGPDWDADDIATKPYGRYTVIYDITNENGQEFLRFNRFEKE